MIVISQKAAEEAERLGQQSFPLKPMKLTDSMIHQVTSIDGAVLLDHNGVCHAIGVILDGVASEKGDASRGARYNSAIRYYEQFGRDNPTMIVIISEDGMINLVPNLMPQIAHSDIADAIQEFKSLLNNQSLNHKGFNYGMDYFRSIRFYLTQAECDAVNALRGQIEDKFAEDLAMMRIVYTDLKPNPEMNDSYYKDE